jgi:hypothetical protein
MKIQKVLIIQCFKESTICKRHIKLALIGINGKKKIEVKKKFDLQVC